MNIFLIGGTGNIGPCILREALSRGHRVTALARTPSKLTPTENLTIVRGDVMDTTRLAEMMKGHDAVIVSHGSAWDDPKVGPKTILAADSIIDAMRMAGLSRVIWVGGAGSLFTADGRRVVDAMEPLPDWARSAIWAMAAHYMHLRTIADLDWSFQCPSQGIAPGERTGIFRLGLDDLLVDDKGESFISYEDFSVALIDELEQSRHIRQRYTVGY
ncbi:MAG: NAD(P)H-binding protein [Sphingomonadales bacterium]|nr:NAD(P)H-binding protein [Sphingomonadales bacterium]